MHSDAKFVLVVEKEASFQRLMEGNVLQKLHPCIVVTVSKMYNNQVVVAVVVVCASPVLLWLKHSTELRQCIAVHCA